MNIELDQPKFTVDEIIEKIEMLDCSLWFGGHKELRMGILFNRDEYNKLISNIRNDLAVSRNPLDPIGNLKISTGEGDILIEKNTELDLCNSLIQIELDDMIYVFNYNTLEKLQELPNLDKIKYKPFCNYYCIVKEIGRMKFIIPRSIIKIKGKILWISKVTMI